MIAGVSITSISAQSQYEIPLWVKNIAWYWTEGMITDNEFGEGLSFLIDNDIIKVPLIQELQNRIVQLENENNQLKAITGSVSVPTPTKSIQDLGDFKLVFTKTNDPIYQAFEEMYNNPNTFIGFVGILNNQYSLPYDGIINFKECGFENAYYVSIDRELVMCYELIRFIFNFYSEIPEYDVGKSLLHASLFIFYHEIGHVLVDVYDLPVTGKVEDAVDQFSAVTFISLGDIGKSLVATSSLMFLDQGLKKTKFEDLKFWDEHSLDLQRFYNLTCLVYGSDPKGSSGLVSSGLLPKERADRCPAEYDRVDKSWQVLLEPFRKY